MTSNLIYSEPVAVPLIFWSLIKTCRKILHLHNEIVITYTHIEQLKILIQKHLDDGLSPAEIKKIYSIEHSDFGMFIKSSLKMKLKSVKEAINNFRKQSNTAMTNEKLIYKRNCKFEFSPYQYHNMNGYTLLLEFGIYHPTKNPNGVCRDHIMSIEYGFRNNIPTEFISHPANCQFLLNIDNIKKGSSSWFNLEELQTHIDSFDGSCKSSITFNEYIKLQKSEEHRNKIRKTNQKYMSITNGCQNLRVLKTTNIPAGFWRGMTRNKNKTN